MSNSKTVGVPSIRLTKQEAADIASSKPSKALIKKQLESKAVTFEEKKLKGFLQSGILFIGDPVYMSGDLSQPGSEAIESPENPFLNWGKFTDSLGSEDASLPFPGAIDDSTSAGRGIAVQTHRLSGRFEIEKTFDENGKLSQLLVKFYE